MSLFKGKQSFLECKSFPVLLNAYSFSEEIHRVRHLFFFLKVHGNHLDLFPNPLHWSANSQT